MEGVMASNAFKNLGTAVPSADASNYHGTPAYKLSSKAALAQLAVTGCFTQTYYTNPEDQLQRVLGLVKEVEPEFVGKLAVYARQSGYMKDMPAALVVYLTTVDAAVARKVFPKVIDNGKMLRNFVQILRSGAFGRHNVSSATMKRLLADWFNTRTDDQIFNMSLGSNPSFGDILKMARVPPKTKERSALHAHLIGKETARFGEESFLTASALPARVAAYELYRKNPVGELPHAPFEMLLGFQLDESNWKEVARRATWFQTFKNLVTFARHGVFNDPAMVKLVADKLRDEKLIKSGHSKVFPYQIMMAYMAAVDGLRNTYGGVKEDVKVPPAVAEALQDAMEIAADNVPAFDGEVVVCPDVSPSMSAQITGERTNKKGEKEQHTTLVRCHDVAALYAVSMLRKTRGARIIPFDAEATASFRVNPRDSIMTNVTKIKSAVRRGGTDCSAPLRVLNQEKAHVDLILMVSDYESWSNPQGYNRGTALMGEWRTLKQRCPNAKMVCMDLTPHATTQAPEAPDMLNVGGFSDKVFEVVDTFANGKSKDHWVDVIEKVEL
jgi:60 kDa SS-A/Ro ribonucleoprotein